MTLRGVRLAVAVMPCSSSCVARGDSTTRSTFAKVHAFDRSASQSALLSHSSDVRLAAFGPALLVDEFAGASHDCFFQDLYSDLNS